MGLTINFIKTERCICFSDLNWELVPEKWGLTAKGSAYQITFGDCVGLFDVVFLLLFFCLFPYFILVPLFISVSLLCRFGATDVQAWRQLISAADSEAAICLLLLYLTQWVPLSSVKSLCTKSENLQTLSFSYPSSTLFPSSFAFLLWVAFLFCELEPIPAKSSERNMIFLWKFIYCFIPNI